MSETRRCSMSDAMTKQMADTLRNNVDEIGAVLGIDVGTGPNDEKLAALMAGVVMDCITGRMIHDPGHVFESVVKDCKLSGSPMPVDEQELRANWAIQVLPYWSGKREQPTRTVLWNMLLTGQFPHKPSMADVNGVLDLCRRFNPLEVCTFPDLYQTLNRRWAALSDIVKDFCGEPSAEAFSAYMQSAAESDAALAAERVASALTSFQESLKSYTDSSERELRAEAVRRYGISDVHLSMDFLAGIRRPAYVDADAVASELRRFSNRSAFGRQMAKCVKASMDEPASQSSMESE